MDPYGFGRVIQLERVNGKIPKNVFQFAKESTKLEYKRIRFGTVNKRNKKIPKYRKQLNELSLSNEEIWKREQTREDVECSVGLRVLYDSLCTGIDIVYLNKPIQRFYFLETVARMPYFSYVSVLHLYETLGWWSISANLRRKHIDEDIVEGYHLMIMESLGGSIYWKDRFLARHVAILYFFVLVPLYLFSPSTAYKSSELLELHAVDTYRQFCEENKTQLEKMPVPNISRSIYGQTITNLYEIFWLIASDELDHATSMKDLTK